MERGRGGEREMRRDKEMGRKRRVKGRAQDSEKENG